MHFGSLLIPIELSRSFVSRSKCTVRNECLESNLAWAVFFQVVETLLLKAVLFSALLSSCYHHHLFVSAFRSIFYVYDVYSYNLRGISFSISPVLFSNSRFPHFDILTFVSVASSLGLNTSSHPTIVLCLSFLFFYFFSNFCGAMVFVGFNPREIRTKFTKTGNPERRVSW